MKRIICNSKKTKKVNMKLREWLTESKMTVQNFSLLVDAERGTVFHWLAGRFKPNKFYMAKIQKITMGKVKKEDFE